MKIGEEEAESKLQLIDFSSEDDILVDYPFRDSLEDFRLSVSFKNISEDESLRSYKIKNPIKVENAENNSNQREEKLSTSETFEPRRPSYLRKSIAWDNAFFSSPGVLEPEELSVMNNGFKEEKSLFPGIQDDLKFRGSDDPDFAFDGDSFPLESNEGDLFEDIRLSIYRSCGMPNLTNASREFGKTTKQKVPSSAKIQVSSPNKKKTSTTSKGHTTDYHASKTTTGSPLPPRNLQHIQGVYKSKSEITGSQNAISTRQTTRASWGYGNSKNKKTGNGGCVVMPKPSASLDSSHFLSFSTPPTKSSSSVSVGATKTSSRAGSSCDKFSSNSSSKSILSSQTRTMGSSTTTVDSSRSNSKPPLRYSGRTRSRLSNSISSIHLLSMSHHLTDSPASSIDGWSSESSSTSSAIVKRRSGYLEDNLRADASPASDLYRSPGHLNNHKKLTPNQNTEVASTETSHVPRQSPKNSKPSSAETSHVPQESPKNSKPSRLRMPSPKIGFFDEGKSVTPIPVNTMQFQIGSQNALFDLNPTAIKRKSTKSHISRKFPGTTGDVRHLLTQSMHCTSSTKHQSSIHSKKLDDASPKSVGLRNSLGPGLLRTDTSFEVDNSYWSKTRKVGKGEHDRKKIVLTSSLKAEQTRTKGILKSKMGKEGKDQKAENGILPKAMDSRKKDHEAGRQLVVEGDLRSMCESKENFEDLLNGLSKCFERINIEGDVIIKLKGKKTNTVEEGKSLDCAQQQGSPGVTTPTPHSIATDMDTTPNTRTPLADKHFACHESGSL